MEDKIEGLGNGRVIIQRDFDQLETELQEARTQISGFQREQIRHDDEIVLARVRISTLEMIIEDIQLLFRTNHDIMDMINDQDIEHTISPTPPPDYPLMNYLSGRTEKMAPKRTSTSIAPTMTQAAIKKLVADSVSAALEAQVATMANTDNTNRNTGQRNTDNTTRNTRQRETPIARKLFLRSNCTEDYKVKFATGTLTGEALFWTEVKKMEDEFYNLTVKGNDLKTYVRRFQELAVLCPNMVPNTEKLMEVFIGGLPRSIEGNVTALKPQTLEEAITIT
ncbi:hypothetical protein Tco_1089295 [Tanacetum coccineum]